MPACSWHQRPSLVNHCYFPCCGGPSHSLWNQKYFCILGRSNVCSSMGMTLLPSCTLSGSLGLMLNSAQHPSLQITWTTPPWVAAVVCARQLGWTELFTWLLWLLVVWASWPEEKLFACNTCHGDGFARAEGKTRLLCSLGFLSVCGYSSTFLAPCCPERF